VIWKDDEPSLEAGIVVWPDGSRRRHVVFPSGTLRGIKGAWPDPAFAIAMEIEEQTDLKHWKIGNWRSAETRYKIAALIQLAIKGNFQALHPDPQIDRDNRRELISKGWMACDGTYRREKGALVAVSSERSQ
jgi:hypothetical protein